MPAIGSQMSHDPLRAGPLAHRCRHHWIGFGIFGIRHSGITRLSQRSDVIDINSQPKSTH
jgi:hypothetical protein